MSATILAEIVDAARTKIEAGRYVEVIFGDRRFTSEPLNHSGLVQVRYDLTAVQTFSPSMVPGSQRNGFAPFVRNEPCEAIVSCQSTEVGATEDEHLAYLAELSDAVVDALFAAARARKVDLTNWAGTFVSLEDDQTSMRGVHFRLTFSLVRAVTITPRATSVLTATPAITVSGVTPLAEGQRVGVVCAPEDP